MWKDSFIYSLPYCLVETSLSMPGTKICTSFGCLQNKLLDGEWKMFDVWLSLWQICSYFVGYLLILPRVSLWFKIVRYYSAFRGGTCWWPSRLASLANVLQFIPCRQRVMFWPGLLGVCLFLLHMWIHGDFALLIWLQWNLCPRSDI